MIGGMLGPRVIGRLGAKRAVAAGFAVQAAGTLPLVFLSDVPGWLAVLLAAIFVGGVANLVAIVGFMVTATSGLPDAEQGLATGLTTMSQQVGITVGTPVMSVIATASGAVAASGVAHGVAVALAVNAAACLFSALLFSLTLPATPRRTGVRRKS